MTVIEFENKIKSIFQNNDPKDNEFLYKKLENLEENIQEADLKTSRLIIQLFIYCFIVIALISFSKEQVTVFFIKIDEISIIEIFCPILISFKYFELLTFMSNRSTNYTKYEILFEILYPNISKHKIEGQFTPHSLIDSLRRINHSRAFIGLLGKVGFGVISIIILFGSLGFLIYIYKILSLKYLTTEIADFNTPFYYISVFISVLLIVFSFSMTTQGLSGKRKN